MHGWVGATNARENAGISTGCTPLKSRRLSAGTEFPGLRVSACNCAGAYFTLSGCLFAAAGVLAGIPGVPGRSGSTPDPRACSCGYMWQKYNVR